MSNGLKLAIIIFLLTLVVVVINPKTHKGIEISSSSNVVFKTDDSYINNQDLKISNSEEEAEDAAESMASDIVDTIVE